MLEAKPLAWVDTDVAEPATHALIVGTSRYPYLNGGDAPVRGDHDFGLAQVSCPAASAYRVARWLVDNRARLARPLASVRLLLSPSQAEIDAMPELAAWGRPENAATRANVETSLYEWKAACGGGEEHVALLYAAGHGLQTSKEGAIVLLEDFNRPDRGAFHGAMDVGSIRLGMGADGTAATQFYFVDCCRNHADAMDDFDSFTGVLGLDVARDGAAEVQAVFFSASPGTRALGEAGRGTLFCEALLECLQHRAAKQPQGSDDWQVTVLSLVEHLPLAVSDVAARYQAIQEATAGGQLREAPLLELPEPPLVPLVVLVRPDLALEHARATLNPDEADARDLTFDDGAHAFHDMVSAGLYIVAVRVEPPIDGLRPGRSIPVAAAPPLGGRGEVALR